eukprot:1376461-Lingulodinium_polyedra.AAC.1
MASRTAWAANRYGGPHLPNLLKLYRSSGANASLLDLHRWTALRNCAYSASAAGSNARQRNALRSALGT